ncbi:hypothetical protein CEV32_4801 [Brucella rhizosphaerae]|uniref:Uncharacterized protein n=1 Tax=Brucella rhizosphaerae TaxID=571254 RepID=A0A256FKZ4_9HYPH|nr:hypothetical protein CEV32_4801 [Brucella rhizosphaerae]
MRARWTLAVPAFSTFVDFLMPRGSNRPPVGPEGHDVLTSLHALLGAVMA